MATYFDYLDYYEKSFEKLTGIPSIKDKILNYRMNLVKDPEMVSSQARKIAELSLKSWLKKERIKPASTFQENIEKAKNERIISDSMRK